MPRRTLIVFWTAVVAAVLLLGSEVATFGRLVGSGTVRDYVTFTLAAAGLGASLLVAGRIVFVATRLQRRIRRG